VDRCSPGGYDWVALVTTPPYAGYGCLPLVAAVALEASVPGPAGHWWPLADAPAYADYGWLPLKLPL
jgi:hypothetical protein